MSGKDAGVKFVGVTHGVSYFHHGVTHRSIEEKGWLLSAVAFEEILLTREHRIDYKFINERVD